MSSRQHGSEPPTVDRIRADISAGRTGEKVSFPDPAAAPLGTDDEAAGTPASREQRQLEDEQRPTPRTLSKPTQGPVFFYMSIIAVIPNVIAIAVFWIE